MKQFEAVRREIQRKLPDLRDEEWDELARNNLPQNVASGNCPLDSLVELAMERRAIWGGQEVACARPDQSPVEKPSTAPSYSRRIDLIKHRHFVLSQMIARRAARDEEVIRFRQDVLGSRALAPDEVVDWVVERAPNTPLDEFSVGLASGFVHFEAKEDGAWKEWFVSIAQKSLLDRLRILSERLAAHFTWDRRAATTFTLTGLVPMISPIEMPPPSSADPSALTRLTIVVDPTIPPDILIEEYKQARAVFFEGERHRSIQEKHLELANFVDQCDQTESWSSRYQRWHERFPDWPYPHLSHFRRDALQARERLLYPIRLNARGWYAHEPAAHSFADLPRYIEADDGNGGALQG